MPCPQGKWGYCPLPALPPYYFKGRTRFAWERVKMQRKGVGGLKRSSQGRKEESSLRWHVEEAFDELQRVRCWWETGVLPPSRRMKKDFIPKSWFSAVLLSSFLHPRLSSSLWQLWLLHSSFPYDLGWLASTDSCSDVFRNFEMPLVCLCFLLTLF